MSLLHCLGYTRVSVQVRGFLCECFLTWYVFTMRSCQHLAQPWSWRTTPCRLSETAYSIYSQLHSILELFLHPQPEDTPFRGDRDPLITDLPELQVVFIPGTFLLAWRVVYVWFKIVEVLGSLLPLQITLINSSHLLLYEHQKTLS
jgi:hypothetical protein